MPISDCLTPSQGTGELENIGQEMIVTATRLNAEARRDPAGTAAVELGYLIGAVSKGADSAHTDLVRRLTAPPSSARPARRCHRSSSRRSVAGTPLDSNRARFLRGMAARTELWGDETSKAVENFQISGQTIPAPVIHWLGRLKAAAARANAELGQLDSDLAEKIAKAGDEVANGEHDDQFPIDIFQTGSGTSSNMNANEVIAELAGDAAHPNDHVNMGQSSNDVFPSAVHLAALGEVQSELLPALDGLCSALERKAAQFNDIVKAGRTHLMDAVPVTLGQEFAGFAAQIRLGAERVRSTLGRVGQIPLGAPPPAPV